MEAEQTPDQSQDMDAIFTDHILATLSPEDVLSRYTTEERLKGLSIEEIRQHLNNMQEKDIKSEKAFEQPPGDPMPPRYVESGFLHNGRHT